MSRSQAYELLIRKNLCKLLEVKRIDPDEDGEYAFNADRIHVRLRVKEDLGFISLEFLALLLQRPKYPGRVLRALNDVNGSRVALRVFKQQGDIAAAWVLPVETMDAQQFREAVEYFCASAEDIGRHLQRRFGGRLPISAGRDPMEEPVDA